MFTAHGAASASCCHHVDQQEQQLVQVLLMLDRRPDDAPSRQLAWILGLAAVSGALLVSLFSAWLVRRGLAPLHSLVEQTRQLGAKDLTHDWQTRLDDSNQPQELRPLIAQFNALLERAGRGLPADGGLQCRCGP
jgi:two-component system heavy metal sensor histidine kinase CusS